MSGPDKNIRKQLKSLEAHLREENPVLVSSVEGFRQLSRIGYAMGLLDSSESYATQISWWPLISVLGTFSSGKSTFINQYLSYPLQDTGNQAVDDKFTVICYSGENEVRVLPGVALDADPRFPFYQTSEELEKVEEGEGRKVDTYLQLKTCHSENMKGRILIDSPGFDADAQRSATLRLTNHIIDLSDLVLAFFDARHPEPGAMSDTLAHLVRNTKDRADSSKFLYILNQIDTTAREDNPEEVVGAWQRSLAREELTAGRFYCIYDSDAAVHIEDEALRRRFEWKRDQDLSEILDRIDQVSVERVYRVVGSLEKRAQEIEEHYVPRIHRLVRRWGRRVLRNDILTLIGIAAALVGFGVVFPGLRDTLSSGMAAVTSSNSSLIGAGAGLFALVLVIHFWFRRTARKWTLGKIAGEYEENEAERLSRAFRKNSRFWNSIFRPDPVGWTRRNQKRLLAIKESADHLIQSLNDQFTDPSGKRVKPAPVVVEKPVEPEPVIMTGEVMPRTESG